MKEIFSKASKTVNTNLILIFIVGICGVRMFSGVMTYISLFGLLVSFLLSVIICGRLIAEVQGVEPPPNLEILKANIVNYILAGLLIALPALAFGQIASLIVPSPILFMWVKEGISAIINIMTIYVIPIVFLKRQSLVAVMAGIAYFFNNVKRSTPIIILVIFMFAISNAVWVAIIDRAEVEESMLPWVPVTLVANIAVSYLVFMIFTAAAQLILGDKSDDAGIRA